MKRLKKTLLFIVLISVSIFSCNTENSEEKVSPVGKLLEGKHVLRKFKTTTEEGYKMNGSYFLFAGSVNGGTFKDSKVAFSFQLPDSTFAMAEIDFVKIRVRIDNTINQPYVTFRWQSGIYNYSLDYIMRRHVDYMVVHCKEEDFPYEVNITDL